MIRNWLFILTVMFLSQWPAITTFAQSQNEPEQLSLPFENANLKDLYPNLKSKLQQTYQVVASRETTSAEKTLAVNQFFDSVDNMCVTNCGLLIEQLKNLNSSLKPLQGETSKLESALPKDTPRGVITSIEAVANYAKNLERLYNKNPQNLIYRLQAAIEATRTLVGFEQEALFKILSKDQNENREGKEQLKQDIDFLFRQGKGMIKILSILQRHHSSSNSGKFNESEVKEIVNSINDLGIFYIKLAQTFSNLSSAVPSEITQSLKKFQDGLEPMSPEEARRILTQELGENPDHIFIDLDFNKPIANGSIAPVYEAKVRNRFGTLESVVVKIQRPGLKEQLDYNRKLNKLALKLLNMFSLPSIAPIMDIVSSEIIGLENSFEGELDFKREARNLKRFSWHFSLHNDIVIPKVYSKYTTSKVLVMQKLTGKNLERSTEKLLVKAEDLQEKTKNMSKEEAQRFTEIYKVANPEIETLEKMFASVLESTIYMNLVLGEFHSDLHPGNILVDQDANKLSLIDFGQTMKTRGLLSKPFWAGLHLFRGDSAAFSRAILSMSENPNFPLEKIKAVVDESFKNNNVHAFKISNPKNTNSVANLQKTLGEIIARLYKNEGFRASTNYFQFLRSFLPVASSLMMMGRGLQPFQIAKISLMSFFKGYVLGSFKHLAIVAPTRFAEVHSYLSEKVNELTLEKQKMKSEQSHPNVLRCRNLLHN